MISLAFLLRSVRPSPPPRSGQGRRARPTLEELEPRNLPSIVWVNEGTPSDTFTPAEHALIHEAISLWQQRLTLNGTLDVTFTGGSTSSLNLGPGVLGETTNVTANDNGTTSADIAISSNGGGAGWFIDPTPQDNSEFTPAGPFSFVNGPPQVDMLTTITHELGHALGLITSPNLLGHLTPLRGNRALFTGSDGYQARVQIDGEGIHLPDTFYPMDLMNPFQDVGMRELPSDNDVHILADTYGYGLVGLPPSPVAAQTRHQDTAGIYDPGTATWYLRNENSTGLPDAGVFPFGLPGWIPVVGDWNGDGVTTIGVVDPSTMTWYLRNENNAGPPDLVFQYGLPGTIPVVGDWNGDGVTTIGVVDPSTMTWYLRNENTNSGVPDAGVFQYGLPGTIPVVGDWNGDGVSTIGVIDRPTSTWYLRNENSAGTPDVTPFSYGLGGWPPVLGHWVDLSAPPPSGGALGTVPAAAALGSGLTPGEELGGAPSVPGGLATASAGPWFPNVSSTLPAADGAILPDRVIQRGLSALFADTGGLNTGLGSGLLDATSAPTL